MSLSLAERGPAAVASARPLRVALAGCGVVGGGVAARLDQDPRFNLVGVLVRDPARPRDPEVERRRLLTDPAALLAREPDVLVDCLSDASTGLALTRAALSRGVHVVSAAKQAVGADPAGLAALARANGARLAYSAAVGGGAPMIETVTRARAHDAVVRIEAVLNGTVNFMLNRLAGGADFDAALADARTAGFAEEDPSADLSGRDAGAKLSLLSYAAWGATAAPALDALTPAVRAHGRVLRQLSIADATSDGTVEASVRLAPAADDALFADLPDEWNALRVTCADGSVFSCKGRGAGRAPTAASVWSDLLALVER